jgi:hypothetical protein
VYSIIYRYLQTTKYCIWNSILNFSNEILFVYVLMAWTFIYYKQMILWSNLYNKHSFLEKWNFRFNRFREERTIYTILKPMKNPLKIHISTPKIVKKTIYRYNNILLYYIVLYNHALRQTERYYSISHAYNIIYDYYYTRLSFDFDQIIIKLNLYFIFYQNIILYCAFASQWWLPSCNSTVFYYCCIYVYIILYCH